MKRNIIVLTLLAFIGLISLPLFVKAETITTGIITAEANLRVRSGPGTNYSQIGSALYNTMVTIHSYSDSGNGCEDKWAYITTFDNIKGYVCSTYIGDIKTKDASEKEELSPDGEKMAKMTDKEFEEYLNSQGFPETYKVKLRELHKKHPTWIFKGIKTKYTWANALKEENQSGTSLMNVNPTYAENGYEGYLSTEEADYNHDKDKFIPHDGTYWFQANKQTIEYYLDPRNFLDEKQIFMFEELFYYPSYQTLDMVKYALSSDFLKQYASYFVTAAKESKVSPIYLASLSRQEVGTSSTNICTNGKAGKLSDGVNYNSYYNFFNIGASSSNNPQLKSLQYAKSAGWNTPKKAIVEGSSIISNNYVNCGQYTSYFQKFNVANTATKGIWHQYSTNVTALSSPAITTYNSYKSYQLIEKDFVFAIPVFDGIPSSTSLPKLGNPNNWLKTLKVNGSVVTNFDSDTLKYTVNVPYSETVKVTATPVNSNAKVTGSETVTLTGDTTTHKVVVTAQNGSKKTYTLTIVRAAKPTTTPGEANQDNDKENNNDGNQTETILDLNEVIKAAGYKYTDKYIYKISLGTSVSSITSKLTKNYPTVTVNIKDKNKKAKTTGTIVTGDKITLSSNGNTKTIEVVIYGDTNGDGLITVVDLLRVQKHIIGDTKLTNSYLTAADVSKDSKVTVLDILKIQKHILKISNISQG